MRGQVPIPRVHALVPQLRAQEAHKHHRRLEGCEYRRVLSAHILILRG